jgi:glycosyltransferase involved in cell wall biosynthesis
LARLQKQLAQLQSEQPEMAQRIHWVGWLAEPRKWMRASEVLLLPARYEGMPNVCLEAMAEGRPVVAFDVQGIRELLGQPSEGQVVPPQDREAWQSAIKKIATDENFRNALGIRNREKIERDFQLSLQLQKYADLYLSLG